MIDGYNLLYAAGICAETAPPHTLERSRAALLNFVASTVDPEERHRTTVVFDAAGAPPGLPERRSHRGILVLFARKHESADALIEELIAAEDAPRRLTVVSSDHRIQRAARRRRATAVDSGRWYASIQQQRRRRERKPLDDGRPLLPLSSIQVQRWLDEFGDEPIEWEEDAGASPRPAPGDPTPEKPPNLDNKPIANPFPPGYGEDLLDDDK